MTDQIGVLGEASVATAATTTVYTCPSAKAARVQIMVKLEAHAATSTGDFLVTVNGMIAFSHLNLPATEIMWSNSTTALHDPSTSVEPDGTTAALTLAPGPAVYFLSAGDTITYTVGTLTFVNVQVQVVGTEIDV